MQLQLQACHPVYPLGEMYGIMFNQSARIKPQITVCTSQCARELVGPAGGRGTHKYQGRPQALPPASSPPHLQRAVGEAEQQAARLALLAVHVQRVHGKATRHLPSGTEKNWWAASPSRLAGGTRPPYAGAVNGWSVY